MSQSAARLRTWIRRSSARKPKHDPWRLKEKSKGIDLSGTQAAASDWDILELKREESAVAASPEKNLGALALLDSWLEMPEIEGDDFGRQLRHRIDEHRLSDRKFFE